MAATFNLSSAATTNATPIKKVAGDVFSLTAYNAGAAAAYVKLYDKAIAPTVGTDKPFLVLDVPAKSARELVWDGAPLRLLKGIALAITGGEGDADTTAVAADQVKVALVYRA